MNRASRMVLGITVLLAAMAALPTTATRAQTAPAKLTFLSASCPGSSSMYTRVSAGQDPHSNENGSPASPADIAAYGCAPGGSLGFFLLANSSADSIFLDEALTQAATVSTSESGPTTATIIASGTTTFVPGGLAQARRLSVANYPSTITTRAAMPFLDLQCLTDGINGDNADGAGWGNQSMASGSENYCIAYTWDGSAAATPSPTATPTAAATATPTTAAPTATPTSTPTQSTTASTNATITVSFPGMSDVHVYAHAADGAPGAGGPQRAAATWKSNSATLTAAKGAYDIRVVHGPVTTVIEDVDCASDCTVDVPLAVLTVTFPGLSDAHTYAHVSDGAIGTYGAQDSSSTWKANSTTLTLLRGIYDVRVVHGPMQTVLDNVDCTGAACSAAAPLATLTVNFPGMSDVHSYAHKSDGLDGTYGAQDSSSTWKANNTTMTLLQGVYDVRVVHGPMTHVFDDVDCRSTTCSATVPTAALTVNFPGMSDVHSYAHKSDGLDGSYGAQDSSSTWKANSTTLNLLQGVYDVRVVHGPVTIVLDNVDCRAATCSVTVPVATLTVNFPGLTDAHTYAHAADGSPGTYGAQDSSSTWKANSTTLTLLQAVYDIRVVKGPVATVLDNVDCRAATCSVDVPLAELTVNFPGKSDVHTYVRADDGGANSANGAQVSSSTWRANTTSFILLRSTYDVLMRQGTTDRIADAVDCTGPACVVAWDSGAPPPAPTATPTATVKPTVKKSFVSDDDGLITWRLEPGMPADLFVWDASITTCEEHNGASCGEITNGGNGVFSATASGQYLHVSQKIEKDGDTCEVTNTAEYSTSPSAARESVRATYRCSGASTMGWGLFALFAAGAASVAWVVHRKSEWQR